MAKILDGEPCGHKGCLQHLSHPCEGCGKIQGEGVFYDPSDPDYFDAYFGDRHVVSYADMPNNPAVLTSLHKQATRVLVDDIKQAVVFEYGN
jgi:hypothetical protein